MSLDIVSTVLTVQGGAVVLLQVDDDLLLVALDQGSRLLNSLQDNKDKNKW